MFESGLFAKHPVRGFASGQMWALQINAAVAVNAGTDDVVVVVDVDVMRHDVVDSVDRPVVVAMVHTKQKYLATIDSGTSAG